MIIFKYAGKEIPSNKSKIANANVSQRKGRKENPPRATRDDIGIYEMANKSTIIILDNRTEFAERSEEITNTRVYEAIITSREEIDNSKPRSP